MASTYKGEQNGQGKASPSLRDQGHQQVMEYLRLADQSTHPEIRDVALEIAKETSKAAIELEKVSSTHQRKQEARVPPTLILLVNLVLGVAVALGSWYAYLHYQDDKAARVTFISLRVYLIFVAITLLLSGHLSQANFMKIFDWFKTGLNLVSKKLGLL